MITLFFACLIGARADKTLVLYPFGLANRICEMYESPRKNHLTAVTCLSRGEPHKLHLGDVKPRYNNTSHATILIGARADYAQDQTIAHFARPLFFWNFFQKPTAFFYLVLVLGPPTLFNFCTTSTAEIKRYTK